MILVLFYYFLIFYKFYIGNTNLAFNKLKAIAINIMISK